MMKRRLLVFISCAVLLAVCAHFFVQFLEFHQSKIDSGGIVFNDPILGVMPRGDVSLYIFSITYGSILLFLLLRLKKPMEIAKFGMSIAFMLLLRMLTMTLLPLSEPTDLVSLNDPILYDVVFSNEITADLFFSGHTAFLFTIYFLSKKPMYLILGTLLGFLLMTQRVHYSIDIIAAIPFSYLITRVVQFVFKKMKVE